MKKKGIVFASGILLALTAFVTLAPIIPPPPVPSPGAVWGAITGTIGDQTDLAAQFTAVNNEIAAKVSNTAYNEATWNDDNDHAPSKNAVRDKIESMAHSGGVIGTASVVLDGLGVHVPAFSTGILAGGTTFNSAAAGRITATFASAQPDANYSFSFALYQDGMAKISNKTVDGFEIRAVDPGLVEYSNVIEISVLRLSQ